MEFTCGGWQNTPGMCLLECVLLIECVPYILGVRRIRLICVFWCGETRTRRILLVWGVCGGGYLVCVSFQPLLMGRQSTHVVQSWMGLIAPLFFSFSFSFPVGVGAESTRVVQSLLEQTARYIQEFDRPPRLLRYDQVVGLVCTYIRSLLQLY